MFQKKNERIELVLKNVGTICTGTEQNFFERAFKIRNTFILSRTQFKSGMCSKSSRNNWNLITWTPPPTLNPPQNDFKKVGTCPALVLIYHLIKLIFQCIHLKRSSVQMNNVFYGEVYKRRSSGLQNIVLHDIYYIPFQIIDQLRI